MRRGDAESFVDRTILSASPRLWFTVSPHPVLRFPLDRLALLRWRIALRRIALRRRIVPRRRIVLRSTDRFFLPRGFAFGRRRFVSRSANGLVTLFLDRRCEYRNLLLCRRNLPDGGVTTVIPFYDR